MASPGSGAKDRNTGGHERNSDRSRSGATGGSAGRPGGVGNVGQTNSAPTYSNGAPIHTATGPVYGGIQTAAGPALQQQNQLRADTYNKAARAWNESANQHSFANLLNSYSPMGFSMQPPDINRPSTFGGGDYHLGWNPGSLLGLAGATVPGAGILTGAMGQGMYTAMGGKNPVLGGPGDMGMKTWDASVTNPQGPNTPSSLGEAGRSGGQNGGQQLAGLAQLNSNVSGNSGAPQSVGAPTPAIPGPNYQQMMASMRHITPGYGVSLPQYNYTGRATV